MDSVLSTRIKDSTRAAMRARDKARVSVLRLINAEMKQVELDQQTAITDTAIVNVLSRMVKQRQASAEQYRAGNRFDLVDQELYEVEVIKEFLPTPLTEAEIRVKIGEVCTELNASNSKDIGRVMGRLSKSLVGTAEMSVVSQLVRERLNQ